MLPNIRPYRYPPSCPFPLWLRHGGEVDGWERGWEGLTGDVAWLMVSPPLEMTPLEAQPNIPGFQKANTIIMSGMNIARPHNLASLPRSPSVGGQAHDSRFGSWRIPQMKLIWP